MIFAVFIIDENGEGGIAGPSPDLRAMIDHFAQASDLGYVGTTELRLLGGDGPDTVLARWKLDASLPEVFLEDEWMIAASMTALANALLSRYPSAPEPPTPASHLRAIKERLSQRDVLDGIDAEWLIGALERAWMGRR